MDIEKVKKEMTDYRDLIGGSLLDSSDIEICETKEELAEIIDKHNDHLEGVLNDTQSALSRFKIKLGLSEF
tara:strand:- start:387 stop:599 length:213 start_codon:yes stop_codon:yes gene_type:complete